ncbi:hypothetical protein TWF730_007476 [Orbilia blumenaviensis]|uniref:Transmembrane protein n=1 Tax=Orbilia blumenaviensis TaxID=1796055 RepID=A0AAV9VAG9_9PEZI
MGSIEGRRRSPETVTDSESAGGTVVLYRSPPPGPAPKELEETESVSQSSSTEDENHKKKRGRKRTKVQRILAAIYDNDPEPELPSARQLSRRFWEKRFRRLTPEEIKPRIKQRGDYIDDEEMMRRPPRRRGRKRRWYEVIEKERPPPHVIIGDGDGRPSWLLDTRGKFVTCCCRCGETLVGEIRVYAFFLISIAYLGLWISVYGKHSATWNARVAPFLIGSWTQVHTYPYGGPTVTRTLTGHIVTYGKPLHYPATTTTEPDYTAIGTPNLQVWI